jgi:acyl-CoA synthetase (AMP-forming)/AMP-acid ligase II
MISPTTSLWQLLERRADISADKRFLINAETGAELSFGEFSEQATLLAQRLLQQGIKRGTVVAWQMPTSIEAALLTFALSRLGAIQAPIIHLYREREVAEILRQSQPQFVIVLGDSNSNQLLSIAENAIADLTAQPVLLDYRNLSIDNKTAPPLPAFLTEPDAVLWYFFTSGTTARPKGARHSDESLMTGAFFLGDVLDVNASDVGSIAYPIAHIGGVLYLTMALKKGIAVLLLPKYTAALVIESFQKYQVSLAGGSTAHYQVLLAEQRKCPDKALFPSLRLLAGGGAAKPAALYWQVKDELGLRIIHAYGMTEAPITSSNTPHDTDRQLTDTDGEVLPSLELRVVDSNGHCVEPETTGEILLRGANLCQGYLLEEQTAAAFDDEGFFHTGDLGRMGLDGHLSITGRLKEIIIRKGENISAREIEELLAKHPAVKDIAVIGLPDEERGELVCAVIELVKSTNPLTYAQMKEYLVSQQLMPQKIPERLEVLDCLPRNESLQKIQKNLLVEQFSV